VHTWVHRTFRSKCAKTHGPLHVMKHTHYAGAHLVCPLANRLNAGVHHVNSKYKRHINHTHTSCTGLWQYICISTCSAVIMNTMIMNIGTDQIQIIWTNMTCTSWCTSNVHPVYSCRTNQPIPVTVASNQAHALIKHAWY
jgi:hypothetical protein